MSKFIHRGTKYIVYNVWISGTKLGVKKKSCISDISIKETVEGSDVATLTIADPDFLYIEDDIFVEKNTIKIELGWGGYTHRDTFNGYISAIDIDFGPEGIPTLRVTCMDKTHKMNRKKKNRTFKNKTSAEVVKKIVKAYGFSCVVSSKYKFAKQETITQSGQTDIEFITNLAGNEVHPFTARLIGNTFYYVRMGRLTTPKMTLAYKQFPHEIISFSPKINKEIRREEIKKSKVNTKTKSVHTTTGKTSTKKGSTTKNGSVSSKKASGSKTGKHTPSKKVSYVYNPRTGKWVKKRR